MTLIKKMSVSDNRPAQSNQSTVRWPDSKERNGKDVKPRKRDSGEGRNTSRPIKLTERNGESDGLFIIVTILSTTLSSQL